MVQHPQTGVRRAGTAKLAEMALTEVGKPAARIAIKIDRLPRQPHIEVTSNEHQFPRKGIQSRTTIYPLSPGYTTISIVLLGFYPRILLVMDRTLFCIFGSLQGMMTSPARLDEFLPRFSEAYVLDFLVSVSLRHSSTRRMVCFLSLVVLRLSCL